MNSFVRLQTKVNRFDSIDQKMKGTNLKRNIVKCVDKLETKLELGERFCSESDLKSARIAAFTPNSVQTIFSNCN